MKTLNDFIATRQKCADLGPRFGAHYFNKSPRAGFVYDGDYYIECEDDGTFYLILYRDEYRAATLAELEPILYLFAVTESPNDMQVPRDVHALICNLERYIGTEKLARAIAANIADNDPLVCRVHDYCDANYVALETWKELQHATEYDIDEAAALYDRAAPILKGERPNV